jgi:hypothetical protein
MQLIYRIDEVYAEWSFKGVRGTLPTIALQVRGSVNTTGWTQPTLVPRTYTHAPADGILDLDFDAAAPTGIAHQTVTTIFGLLLMLVPQWVAGVRVHSSTNFMESALSVMARGESLPESLPLPWPFPWVWPSEKTE